MIYPIKINKKRRKPRKSEKKTRADNTVRRSSKSSQQAAAEHSLLQKRLNPPPLGSVTDLMAVYMRKQATSKGQTSWLRAKRSIRVKRRGQAISLFSYHCDSPSSMVIEMILAALVGCYIISSVILFKFPMLLHKRKDVKFVCRHISHRGGELRSRLPVSAMRHPYLFTALCCPRLIIALITPTSYYRRYTLP